MSQFVKGFSQANGRVGYVCGNAPYSILHDGRYRSQEGYYTQPGETPFGSVHSGKMLKYLGLNKTIFHQLYERLIFGGRGSIDTDARCHEF